MSGKKSAKSGKNTSKPKILFVFDNPHEDRWVDGLWSALNLLEKDFDVIKYNKHNGPPEDSRTPDFILGWGAFGSEVDKWVQKMDKYKRGLCIAGCATPPEGAENYNVLFYETKWYRDQIKFHENIVHAFGINTDIFNEIGIPTPIIWDYISSGAFASWKRHEKLLDKKGSRLAVGYYQDDNEQESLEIVRNLIKGGVMVSNHINPYDLANLFHMSRTCYVPSTTIGGGERTVLEARACGLIVEVEDDNPKLKELLESPIYDQHYYAKQLKKGIMSVL